MMKTLRLLIMTILMTLCIYGIAGKYIINLDELTEVFLTRENETSNRFDGESVRVKVRDVSNDNHIIVMSSTSNITTAQGTLTFGVSM